MLRYFSYRYAAKIFLIKYDVVQASQKKQHTIPAEVLPNDSEALFYKVISILNMKSYFFKDMLRILRPLYLVSFYQKMYCDFVHKT